MRRKKSIGDSELPGKSTKGREKNAGHPTRRVRYRLVMSLDGFIAGPNGEADWIPRDPEVDFQEIYSQFDTILVGRRTFEVMKAAGAGSIPGMQVFVFSRTLQPEDWKKTFRHPDIGLMTLDKNLALYSWHGRHHVAHITSLRERMGW